VRGAKQACVLSPPVAEPKEKKKSKAASKKQLAAVLGGCVGGGLAILSNYFVYEAVGPEYPAGPTSFVFFALGALGGMAVSDRLGKKALKVMGIAAGILIALTLLTVLLLAG
jgi:hypothetical protein